MDVLKQYDYLSDRFYFTVCVNSLIVKEDTVAGLGAS